MVRRDPTEILDLQDPWDQQDHKVFQDPQDQVDPSVILDPKAHTVIKESQEIRAQLAHQGIQDQTAPQDLQDPKDPMENKE